MRVRLAAAALFAAAPLVAQTPSATLDRATAAYAKMETAKVTFTQTVTNPLTGRAADSKGEMLQRLPGHYAVTFSDPAGDRIVSDGKVVWIYLPSTNPGQVIKMHVGDAGASIPDFTSWLLNAPKDRFALADGGKAMVGSRATHIVLLTPRAKNVPFTSAKLWIDDADGIVRQFETMDANGSVRRVRIDAIKMNVPASAAEFQFVVPQGVKVFEQGAGG
jgi:outer membrane lipoprotein carrier protein